MNSRNVKKKISAFSTKVEVLHGAWREAGLIVMHSSCATQTGHLLIGFLNGSTRLDAMRLRLLCARTTTQC